jgi:ABC-2 type transport system permease protein
VVYLTLMCLFAVGTASVARNAVIPLAVLLPMVLIGSQLLSVLGLTKDLARFLPDQAGTHMLEVGSDQAFFGFAVMLAWTAAITALGYLRHVRWDN